MTTIGVIGEPGRLEASIYLTLTKIWCSRDLHIEGHTFAPAYRKSDAMAGVPQIADGLVRRRTRQPWAIFRHADTIQSREVAQQCALVASVLNLAFEEIGLRRWAFVRARDSLDIVSTPVDRTPVTVTLGPGEAVAEIDGLVIDRLDYHLACGVNESPLSVLQKRQEAIFKIEAHPCSFDVNPALPLSRQDGASFFTLPKNSVRDVTHHAWPWRNHPGLVFQLQDAAARSIISHKGAIGIPQPCSVEPRLDDPASIRPEESALSSMLATMMGPPRER